MANVVPSSIGSYVMPQAKPPAPRPKPLNPLVGLLTNPAVFGAGQARDKTITDANALLQQQRAQTAVGLGDTGIAQTLYNQGLIGSDALAATGANQYSTLKNLAHQRDLAHNSLLNSLAAHGLLRSGALGSQEGELARSYGQSFYDATNQALGNLNNYLGNYLGTTQGAQNDYLNALLTAFGQYGQNPLSLLG